MTKSILGNYAAIDDWFKGGTKVLLTDNKFKVMRRAIMLRNMLFELNSQWTALGANNGEDATEGKAAMCIVRLDEKVSNPKSELHCICR